MSFSKTLNYDNAGNFEFDSSKVEIDTAARLKLVPNPGQTFTQDFSGSSGFVFDSSKIEFVGGKLQQKDSTPLNSKIAATYNSALDLSWSKSGALTHSKIGSPSLFNNKLRVPAGNNAVTYNNAAISQAGSVGAIKAKWTPPYSGSPSANTNIFELRRSAGGDIDKIVLFHSPSGNTIRVSIWDENGNSVLLASTFDEFLATAGQEYEIELNWDSQNAFHLFIDGNRLGNIKSVNYIRGNSADMLHVGAGTVYLRGEADYDDIVLFDSLQHSASYTPGYTLNETIYLESLTQLPPFEYTGVGSIISVDAFQIVESNNPRYIVAGLYWDGANWVQSDNTYAQANDSATIGANLDQLSITSLNLTEIPVSALFQGQNSQGSIDDIDVEITGEIYPLTATITENSDINTTQLQSFQETKSTSQNSDVKYILVVNGVDKYFDGSAWVNSDGTQANTAAEINSNATALEVDPFFTLKLKTLLISNGQQNAEITSNTFDFDFYGILGDTKICEIYGEILDGENPVDGASILFQSVGFYRTPNGKTATVNKETTSLSNGYFDEKFPIMAESNEIVATVSYTDARGKAQKYSFKFKVPDRSSAKFDDSDVKVAS